jgi:uncharacterized protein (TIGR00255 family)
MKSMTGYAKRQCAVGNRKITIEIKTLNSKQMDANVKLPFRYHAHDLEIRSMLNRLERGKIDFILTEESDSTVATSPLNEELVRTRLEQLRHMTDGLHVNTTTEQLIDCILRQPDIWNTTSTEEANDEEWGTIREQISAAIDETDLFRLHEGTILQQDFVKHVDIIEQRLGEIPQYESQRIDTAKERIRKYIADFAIKEVDENRFEQELIYYLEKLDITEEKVRLQKHIDYFRSTMDSEECSGKKLGFIAQEMGREINTTGSKANHVAIQQLVVQMKDELEKIKEQLGNIL